MKLDIKKILASLQPIKNKVLKYRTLLIILSVVFLFGFIFYRIGYFAHLEPTDNAIDEKLLNVQRPKIDKTVVDKLEKLQSQSVQVQALFNQARENPFRE